MFANQKKLMKKRDIHHIKIPHYDELSVTNLWPELQKDQEFVMYFPDKFPAHKGPCRDYFMNILNTLYPDYLSQVLDHACKQRHTVQDDDQRMEAIKISDAWLEELQSMPFTSGKSRARQILTLLCM